jgi:hypothetical protein
MSDESEGPYIEVFDDTLITVTELRSDSQRSVIQQGFEYDEVEGALYVLTPRISFGFANRMEVMANPIVIGKIITSSWRKHKPK